MHQSSYLIVLESIHIPMLLFARSRALQVLYHLKLLAESLVVSVFKTVYLRIVVYHICLVCLKRLGRVE
jgi:hypothetical protein